MVRVRDGRGKPWALHEFEDMTAAATFMDEQVAVGRRVKMDTQGNQGGSERHREKYRNRRPMRAAGCYPG